MDSNRLSAEICRRIARWVDSRDLPALARTSRTMQFEAEALIWRHLDYYHSFEVYKILRIIAECPRVGSHVRYLILLEDLNRLRRRQGFSVHSYETFENREYWVVVRRALLNMPNLDLLYISDPLLENSWIFEPKEHQPSANSIEADTHVPVRTMPCQIRDAKLSVLFTSSVAAFLDTQRQLRSVMIFDVAQNTSHPSISQTSLLQLSVFEGPPKLLEQLYHCPLTQIKLLISREDNASSLRCILPELRRFKNLRSLCIGTIHEDLSLEWIDLITIACPNLTYLAFLPYPLDHTSRITFLKYLTRLQNLCALELDITHWVPYPSGIFQRALVIEIQMCITALRSITFWNGPDRCSWMWSREHVQIPPIPQATVDIIRSMAMEELGDEENGEGKRSRGKRAASSVGNVRLELESSEDPGLLAWRLSWGHNVWPMQTVSWRNI